MATEVQWSELQRDPRGVAALAERDDVRIRRRDGGSLLLVREDRAHAAADGALAASRTLRNALQRLGDGAHEALTEEFPWLELLPADDRHRFAAEFGRAVLASAELAQWDVLSQTLLEWRATAAIHSDPALAAELARPVDDDLGPATDGDAAMSARSGVWQPRFATPGAAEGWEDLRRVAVAPDGSAWSALAERPAHPRLPARQHRLRGQLAERGVAGRALPQWQYEVDGGGRIWYCPDAERRVVWVVAAVPARVVAREKGERV